MGSLVETEEYKGYNIEIHVDHDPLDPLREWDNLGSIVAWHRRHNLGNSEEYNAEDFDTRDELEAEIAKDCLYLPLYIYDHSGITINTTGFSCPWDSGQVGFIYVSKEKARKEYSVKRISKKLRSRIYDCLRAEVQCYDDFLTGSVYGYIVKDEEGEEVDSCWGYYGYDWQKNGLMDSARAAIDYEVTNAKMRGMAA